MLGAPTEVKFGGKFRLTSGNGRYQILSSAWNLRRARGNLSGGELVQWLDPQWRGEELVRVLCTQLIAMVSASEAVEGAYPCPSTQSEDVGKFSAGPWYQVGMGQEWWVPPVPLPSKADTETVFLLFEVCTWGGHETNSSMCGGRRSGAAGKRKCTGPKTRVEVCFVPRREFFFSPSSPPAPSHSIFHAINTFVGMEQMVHSIVSHIPDLRIQQYTLWNGGGGGRCAQWPFIDYVVRICSFVRKERARILGLPSTYRRRSIAIVATRLQYWLLKSIEGCARLTGHRLERE